MNNNIKVVPSYPSIFREMRKSPKSYPCTDCFFIEPHRYVHELNAQEPQATLYVINPMADGRCFWSCLYLLFANPKSKHEWLWYPRNEQGFPAGDRQKKEQALVLNFVASLLAPQMNHEDPESHGTGFIKLINKIYIYIYACNTSCLLGVG